MGEEVEVELTKDTRNPAQNTQQDVDEEIRVAARLEEDCQGGKEECEEVEANIALETVGQYHYVGNNQARRN